jgi:hypothetical protein
MESWDDFFQVTQASATHSALQVIARETAIYPKWPENINAAGMKMNATMRNATVVVDPVPVDFCWVANIATPPIGDGLRRAGSDRLT